MSSTDQPATIHTTTRTFPPHTILEPNEANITQVINIIAKAFAHTPLFITFLSELNDFTSNTPHSAISPSECLDYYTPGLTRVATNGGVLVSSGSFSTVAVWEPPSFRALDFTSGRKKWGPASREWTGKVKAARIKHLGLPGENVPLDEVNEATVTKLREFWHLGFLARDPDVQKVPGAVSAVVRPFLDRARDEMVPAWLEATTWEGVKMYEYYGFRLVETIVVGEGVYGADGWLSKDGKGEGTRGYCMIYDGHLRGEGGK